MAEDTIKIGDEEVVAEDAFKSEETGEIAAISQRLSSLELDYYSNVEGSRGAAYARTTMMSPNYKEGSTGWIIKENGDVEFQDGTFRGEIIAETGTIGGWTITASTLYADSQEVILDSGGVVSVGDTSGQHIELDGSNNRLAYFDSSNELRARLEQDGLYLYSATGFESGSFVGSAGGVLSITPNAGAMIVDGQLNITGPLWAQGDLIVSGSIGFPSDLVPETTAQDLGSSTKRWENVWSKTINNSGTINTQNYEVNGNAGVSFGPGAVTSITVENGIVTAIS